MLSKACIVGQYQSKLEAIARQEDIELTVAVPPAWRDERGELALERSFTRGYTLRVIPIRLNGHFHLHYYPTFSPLLHESAPDIVHIDEEPYNLATFLATRSALQAGASTLFFTWQNIARRYPPPFAWMENYVLRNSKSAIAGNAEAAQVLVSKGYQGPVSVIAQFGLDPQQFSPMPALGANGCFRIGFFGRMVPEKGPDLLLRAAARLHIDWHLDLIGGGPLIPQLEALAAQLGITQRVTFTPWLRSSEMPGRYRNLDLLVVASITRPNWKEQFGRVLIEAMACGVPVIGSKCGEIPNVIGDAGIVVRENDVDALHDAIESLASDRARRTLLAECGRARVLERFTQERVAEETCRVYRGMMPESDSLHSSTIGI